MGWDGLLFQIHEQEIHAFQLLLTLHVIRLRINKNTMDSIFSTFCQRPHYPKGYIPFQKCGIHTFRKTQFRKECNRSRIVRSKLISYMPCTRVSITTNHLPPRNWNLNDKTQPGTLYVTWLFFLPSILRSCFTRRLSDITPVWAIVHLIPAYFVVTKPCLYLGCCCFECSNTGRHRVTSSSPSPHRFFHFLSSNENKFAHVELCLT